MESFNLNIIPGKTRPVCHASQFDAGRVIRVNLFEDANIYTLSGSEEVSLSVRKPDGNVVTVEIENTGDSFVEIVTTEQMTACAGSNLCELKIEDDGKVIGTMNFILETEQDPLEGGIESESSIYNLETQVNGMVTDAVADQYDSDSVIFDQTPTAGHGTGYAVTSEGIKAAIDPISSAVTDLSGEVDALDIAVQAKQNANDAALTTTSKNVAGAINERNAGKQNDLMFGSLPSGTDLNELKTTGFYWVPNTGITNTPVSGAYGVLEVIQVAQATWLQRYTRYGANNVQTQYEVYVREWTNSQWYNWRNVTAVDNTCSVSRTEGAASTLPLPNIQRSGNTVLVSFSVKLSAGNYTTSTKLWTCTPKPKAATYALLHSYKSTMSEVPIYMNSNGVISFNSSFTQNSEDFIVGQLVYLV